MSDEIAAIDLGSNSFHMIVARQQGDSLQVVDRLRESVRLAAGLNAKKQLDKDYRDRALGHSIQVISGYEEARLIYLGVAHSIADQTGQRLVIDIEIRIF